MAQLQGTTVAGDLNVDESAGVAPLFVDSGNDIVATNFDTSTNFSTEPTNSNTDILSSGFIETQTGFVGDGSNITNFPLTNLSDVNVDGDGRAQFPDLPSIATTTTPSKTSDLTTKTYVDGVAQGLEIKDSVDVATDGTNVDLASSTDPNPIDGVTVADGEFVLLKNQSTASENGVYVANTATDPSTWTRRADFDEDDEVQSGTIVFVEKGTANANSSWVVTSNDPIAVGTDDIAFSVFARAGEITAGDGLKQSGSTFNIEPDDFAGTGLQDDGSDNLEIVNEDIQDAIFNNVLSGTQTLITVTYDDANDEVDYVVQDDLSQYDFSNVDTDDIGEGTMNLYFTDERAQDAVGTILGDGFNYDDAEDSITLDNRDAKKSVRAATNGTSVNLTSSTDPNPIDGVTLSDGDRVLLKDQSTGSENGIYVATTATDPTTWTRAADADEDSEVTAGLFVFVEEGTENGDQGFVLSTDNPITVGTTSLTFTRFSGVQVTAGDGIKKSGDTLNIEPNDFAGNGLVDDGSDDLELDVGVSDDGSDVTTSTSVFDLNFGSGLSVTDDTGTTAGRVTIAVDAATATNITMEDSGTDVVSGINNIDFGTNLDVTDNTGTEAGEAIVDATDTRTDVSDSGTTTVSEVEDINFDSNLDVTDDGDGTVTVNGTDTNTTEIAIEDSGTDLVSGINNLDFGTNLNVTDNTSTEAGEVIIDATDTNTQTNVSEDGSQVVANVDDINFTTDITVTDDTDGSVSVEHADTGGATDVTSTAGQVLDSITFDGRGHVESVGTTDVDGRYVEEAGDTMTGTLVIDSVNNTNTGLFIGDPANDDITDTTTFHVADGDALFDNTVTANEFVETSTLRLKENVHRLEDQMQKVMQLQPVSFDWKDSGDRSIGLLAEEVQDIYPEIVSVKDGEAQGINYTKLTSVLIDAVKSMKFELDDIKNRI